MDYKKSGLSYPKVYFITRLKWVFFCCLERVVEILSGSSKNHREKENIETKRSAQVEFIWIFASTIGELNTIGPFLRRFLSELQNPPIVLISDHEHYREPYITKYPSAYFEVLNEPSYDIHRLLKLYPPKLLIIAEIPCMLSDAPCRFSFSIIYELKKKRIPIFLVNGWLYHYKPACCMDWFEKLLFNKDYINLIDLYMVQNESIKQELIAQGAEEDRVIVTGNIKFDAVGDSHWSADNAKSAKLVKAIIDSKRPCIIGGCVTNLNDQMGILDAFIKALGRFPESLLVLAPRHPENKERMEKLEIFLKERNLRYIFKSKISDDNIDGIKVLVLDTVGELKDFYAIATIIYIGPNHNVLEPLSFWKRVFVMPGWEPKYPSYPVYKQMLEEGALCEVKDPEELAEEWIRYLSDPAGCLNENEKIKSVIEKMQGATERNIRFIQNRLMRQA
jgi:3-deoxy-D-manno-octulosonic-acid transferase